MITRRDALKTIAAVAAGSVLPEHAKANRIGFGNTPIVIAATYCDDVVVATEATDITFTNDIHGVLMRVGDTMVHKPRGMCMDMVYIMYLVGPGMVIQKPVTGMDWCGFDDVDTKISINHALYYDGFTLVER